MRTATCVWIISAKLVAALEANLGPPIDSYVNGSQTWITNDGPGEIGLEWRLHPVSDFRTPAGIVDRRRGGIDLQVLGIGSDGHIGFNEPTSSLSSRTRIKTLTYSTREANKAYFSDHEQTPKCALTMGIGTILEADHCVLLAIGATKSEAVAQMIEGPLTAACPATALQLHPRATIILDGEAASGLKLQDYYHHVHPGGKPDGLLR